MVIWLLKSRELHGEPFSARNLGANADIEPDEVLVASKNVVIRAELDRA